ncbi:MAG: hypothetical protein V1746_06545 [bacterium]
MTTTTTPPVSPKNTTKCFPWFSFSSVVCIIAAAAAILFFVHTNYSLQDKVVQLQFQLEQTRNQLQEAKNEIAQTLSQLEQSQSQLEKTRHEITQLQPLAEKARLLPITVSFRKAQLGHGQVLRISSELKKELPLKIKVTSPTFNKTEVFEKIVSGISPLEIGHLQGWAFSSGDLIEISSADFDPITTKMP